MTSKHKCAKVHNDCCEGASSNNGQFVKGIQLSSVLRQNVLPQSTFSLVFTMCLFPRGLLLQHGMCMQLLKSIMDIAFCGDRALQHVDKLDLLARGHQRLFLELYGVESTIPKNHHLFHISKSISRFGTSLTCFKMERMHHTAKQLGEHG